MRKILAGFMATAMVTSICATASFAANKSASITIAVDSGVSGLTATTKYDKARLVISKDATVGNADDISAIASINYTTDAAAVEAEVASGLNNTKFNSVSIDGKVYDLTLKESTTSGTLVLNFSPAVKLTGLTSGTSVVRLELSSDGGTTWDANGVWDDVTLTSGGNLDLGDGGELADVDKGGIFDSENVLVSEVIRSYADGTPIPLTEDPIGADKDLNDKGGVQSSKTLYFQIRDDVVPKLGDDTYWKLKITKGDNGKYIKSVSDVTKIFSGKLYNANTGESVDETGKERRRYIKVELNEIFTDDEYKIGLDMRLSATSKAVNTGIATDDSEIKVKDFTFYMKNIVKDADNDWEVGINGLMLNPVTNDWNTVTYFDEDGDVASLKFFADSDTGKFYSKLSTKWAHEDYAAYFNDQDAFYFEFTGSPKLSSTSRADLHIYNPFVDEDGNETIDPTTATIYQVVDGDLIDVTDSFTYGEGENGDDAFITRTRFLGSYIICEKPVEEAAGESDIEDLVPGENETPEDVTPDNNGGGKAPANTGRYL